MGLYDSIALYCEQLTERGRFLTASKSRVLRERGKPRVSGYNVGADVDALR